MNKEILIKIWDYAKETGCSYLQLQEWSYENYGRRISYKYYTGILFKTDLYERWINSETICDRKYLAGLISKKAHS